MVRKCILQVSGWLGDLGHMMGDRGREERRTQEWILVEGQNTGTSENFTPHPEKDGTEHPI